MRLSEKILPQKICELVKVYSCYIFNSFYLISSAEIQHFSINLTATQQTELKIFLCMLELCIKSGWIVCTLVSCSVTRFFFIYRLMILKFQIQKVSLITWIIFAVIILRDLLNAIQWYSYIFKAKICFKQHWIINIRFHSEIYFLIHTFQFYEFLVSYFSKSVSKKSGRYKDIYGDKNTPFWIVSVTDKLTKLTKIPA